MAFDYEYDGGWGAQGFKLPSDTEVSLVAPDGTIVDSVAYSAMGLALVAGRAHSLSSEWSNGNLNDQPGSWCLATTAIDEYDYGTPGKPNGTCDEPGACGDGKVDSAEECDDGNAKNGDGCDVDCQFQTGVCGNAVKEPAEECDDGNKLDGDGCSGSCYLECCGWPGPACGDGVVQAGEGETCDDGNHVNDDGCDWQCHTESEFCGDGEVGLGEQCDDGNKTEHDGCGSNCKWQC